MPPRREKPTPKPHQELSNEGALPPRRCGAGAGIGLQPIGLTVLSHLGVLPAILQHGHRIDRLTATSERGTSVLDLSYADFRPELHGVGIHRDVLFRELHTAAKAEPNVEIVYDNSIVPRHDNLRSQAHQCADCGAAVTWYR